MGKAERLDGVGVVGAWVAILGVCPKSITWGGDWISENPGEPILIENREIYGDGEYEERASTTPGYMHGPTVKSQCITRQAASLALTRV